MITAILIDDEASGRETLEILLKRYIPEVLVAGIADSATSGKALIEQLRPDLVFLDIQMPGGSGFDLLASLPAIDFELVFVTAYNEFAQRAFQFAALDYIQKPINVERLKEAVKRASAKLARDTELKQLQYQVLRRNFQMPQSQDNKIALPTQNGYSFVSIKQIVRCKGSDTYTEVYFQDGSKETVTRKLLHFEEILKDYRFFRIHKSHLINLNHLVRYTKGRGGEVEMADGAFIEVARRKKAEFLKVVAE